MALNGRLLHKGLVAMTLFVFASVFLRIFSVPHSFTYLPWICGFILLAVNSHVQAIAGRLLGIAGYAIAISISYFGTGISAIYRKSRRIALFLAFIVPLLIFPGVVHAYDFTRPPTKIIIPQAGISLPVFTAKIALDTWEVREDGASFGERTTLPGNTGNTVIFSHAMPHLFGNLGAVEKGAYIHVFTDLDWFVYQVTDTKVVAPEDTDVIFQGQNHELTLYTCTGPSYSKRFVVKARLITPPTP